MPQMYCGDGVSASAIIPMFSFTGHLSSGISSKIMDGKASIIYKQSKINPGLSRQHS